MLAAAALVLAAMGTGDAPTGAQAAATAPAITARPMPVR